MKMPPRQGHISFWLKYRFIEFLKPLEYTDEIETLTKAWTFIAMYDTYRLRAYKARDVK